MKKILFMAVMAIIGVQFSLAQIVSSRTSMTSTTIIEPERKAEPKREIQISNLSIYAGVGTSSIRGDIADLWIKGDHGGYSLDRIKSIYSYKLGAAYDKALGESKMHKQGYCSKDCGIYYGRSHILQCRCHRV